MQQNFKKRFCYTFVILIIELLLGFVFGVSSLSKAGFCTGTLVGLGVILSLVAGELLEALGVFARDLLEERVDMFCETILV